MMTAQVECQGGPEDAVKVPHVGTPERAEVEAGAAAPTDADVEEPLEDPLEEPGYGYGV